jgi:hypothetical protein
MPYYNYALDMVLDVEMPMEDSLTEEQQEIVESAAVCNQFAVHSLVEEWICLCGSLANCICSLAAQEMLYGLIHAR